MLANNLFNQFKQSKTRSQSILLNKKLNEKLDE